MSDHESRRAANRATNKKILLGCAYVFGVLFLLMFLLIMAVAVCETSENGPTPAPSPAPDACPSPAEAAYLDTLDGHMRSFGAQMGLLGERWREAAENPLLLFDDVWVLGRETDLTVLMLEADQMIELSPPSSAVQIDRMVERTMQKTRDALGVISIGVTTPDLDLMTQGHAMMSSTVTEIAVIRAAMDVSVFCDR